MFDPNQLLNAMMSNGMRGSPLSELLGSLAAGGGGGGMGSGMTGGMTGGMAGGGHPLGSILGGLLGGGAPQSGAGGGGNAGLGDLLGGLLGGGAPGQAGMMGGGGLSDVLGGLLGGAPQGGMTGGGAGGMLGQLAGALFGGAGGTMGGAMGGAGGGLARAGGMAMLGALAAAFLKQMGSRGADVPTPQDAAAQMASADPGDLEKRANLMVRGMIAAAKADGTIDADEQKSIIAKLQEGGISAAEREFLERELRTPIDIEALVCDVHDKMTAAQLYMASMLAIKVDTPAEKAYLDALATRLGLPVAAT